MALGIANVNGRNYSHDQVVFQILGVPIVSISDITINNTQLKEFSYGTGQYPVGYGTGKKEMTIGFSMSMNDYEALEAASPNNDVLDIGSFDIPLTIINLQKPISYQIKGVMLDSYDWGTAVDTTDIRVTFTGKAAKMKRKV